MIQKVTLTELQIIRNSLIIRRLENFSESSDLIEECRSLAADDEDVFMYLVRIAREIWKGERECSDETNSLIHRVIIETGGSKIAALFNDINAFS